MLKGINLSYSRGTHPLFTSLSFVLQEGGVLAVRGANGAGKSTLLRLLTGFIRPAPETLFWKGKPLTSSTLNTYQQNLLYVGHKLCLYPSIRVGEQVSLWHDLYRTPKTLIEKALQTWGLATLQDKKIFELSQGQQKRLSLTRCTWLPRPLWVLDEPLAGLDQTGKDILSSLLSHHVAHAGSIIFATHESLKIQSLTSFLELNL